MCVVSSFSTRPFRAGQFLSTKDQVCRALDRSLTTKIPAPGVCDFWLVFETAEDNDLLKDNIFIEDTISCLMARKLLYNEIAVFLITCNLFIALLFGSIAPGKAKIGLLHVL